jgi:hypothetical protein
MFRPFTFLTSLLAGALVLGCNDQSTPSEPRTSPAPSFRTEQNPDGAGAFVIHDEQGAFFFVDEDSGLSVLIGWTFAELNLFCATGEITIGSLNEVLVSRPDESRKDLIHTAQVPLLVWQTASGDLCGALLELPHLTGTGQGSITDNDRFTSGNRTNAAHVGVHGQVTSETGELFQLLGNWHAMILRGSDEQVDRSDFRLVPVG